jgi:hypothetical protein
MSTLGWLVAANSVSWYFRDSGLMAIDTSALLAIALATQANTPRQMEFGPRFHV